jgi:hypothetical protein
MRFKAFCIIPHAGEIEIKPLVLCKECKYFDGGERFCMHIGICIKPDWFCADGEKEETADDG